MERPSTSRRRKPGRRPKLSPSQRASLIEAVQSGDRTAAQMARHFQISPPTVSRILAQARAHAGHPVDASYSPSPERILGGLALSALDQRLAVVGTSGSGKTYATKGLVERLLEAGARVCVVDPLGVWWGLRHAPDGTSPARHPVVVFGGRHADVPLTAGMGARLGHLVGTQALACVIDVSELGSAMLRRAFMTAFTEALHDSNTAPLHLVLDEADLWAPQRVPPDGYDLLGRVEEIVRRGRVRGFIPWLITQRPAVLHKDVLSQADILLSMKLTASQDRAAVGRWIEGQADRAQGQRILAALPRLGRGEGWVWAPAEGVLARVAFPPIHTYDSSETPRRDTQGAAPRAAMDVPALTAALAAHHAGPSANLAANPAANPANDPATALHQRLHQQEHDLATAQARIAELEAALRRGRAQQGR